MRKPSLCIVTPALADANNGNWQTARRWARLLAGHYAVRLASHWPDGASPGTTDDGTDILLALPSRLDSMTAGTDRPAMARPQT